MGSKMNPDRSHRGSRGVNIEFQKALEKKRLFPFTKGKKLIKNELNNAQDDLREAEDRFKNKRYKYATITAYYSENGYFEFFPARPEDWITGDCPK